MHAIITEKQVVQLWQETLRCRAELKTKADESISVIYPGRRNDDRGADFKDAIIATEQGQLKGDIEIHVKTSHWWLHHHHQDPAYNRVILHVVYQNDTVKAIVRENGISVPTLSLCDHIESNNNILVSSSIPCHGFGYSKHVRLITPILDEAGEARFLARVTRLREMIVQLGAGQALYQWIMTALGYSKNKETMTELARRMPLESLETIEYSTLSDSEYLVQCQARLMGTAGLLPSQLGGRYPKNNFADYWEAELENIWVESGVDSCMSINSWNFFKVRPGNHPVRRIAAMSHLLLRYRKTGLLAGLEDSLKDITTDNEASSLEQALMVTPDNYWGLYIDFGLPALGAAPALLGEERAADIVINVLLPFAFARGTAEQGKKILNIYRDYHASAENTLIKHMRQQLGIGRYLINTACRQQGLIHIYQTQCLEGRCNRCPLNNISC
jgi:hypothetical protein